MWTWRNSETTMWCLGMYKVYTEAVSSPLRSTLNTNVLTGLGMCKVYTEAVSSPLRSTLNTNVLTGLGMCKVCTGAVKSPLRSTLNTNVFTGLRMCEVCTGAARNPPRTKSVLTVSKTDINTWFTLGRRERLKKCARTRGRKEQQGQQQGYSATQWPRTCWTLFGSWRVAVGNADQCNSSLQLCICLSKLSEIVFFRFIRQGLFDAINHTISSIVEFLAGVA